MRILVLTSYVPYPPNAGAKIRVSNQMRYLSKEHEVVLMCPVRPDSGQAEEAQKLVGEYCAQVMPIPWYKRSKIKFVPHLLRYIFSGEPIGYLTFYYEELARALYEVTATQHFDIVDIHHSTMASYINKIAPGSKCKTVLALHNVPHVQYRRMMLAEKKNFKRKFRIFRDWVTQKYATLKYIRRYDKTIVVSEMDRALLIEDAPAEKIVAVPTGIHTDVLKPLQPPKDFRHLLFLGALHYQPNIDAARFICEEILPLIRKVIPEVQLVIVGAKPVKEVLELEERFDGVTVDADVESVIPYYDRTCVSLVPIRAGSGVRVKILEAMCLGRPVISTTLGCEGLDVTHNKNILIADTAAALAEQTIRLLTDQNLWREITENARSQVEQVYDWHVTGKKLEQAYKDILSAKR